MRRKGLKSSKNTFFWSYGIFARKLHFITTPPKTQKTDSHEPSDDKARATTMSQPTLITIKSHLEICEVSPKFIILNKYSDL